MAIGNSAVIRSAHNSWAPPTPFALDERVGVGRSDDVFHFVAYVPAGGRVWELDGLRGGPVDLGPVPDAMETGEGPDAWLRVAVPVVGERMARAAGADTAFSAMAVCEDRVAALEEALAVALSTGDEALAARAMVELSDEQAARERAAEENVRRKHNYVPFLLALLKILADKGHMPALLDAAEQERQARLASGSKM